MAGFEEQTYGRYLIQTGPRGMLWQARALLNGKRVGDNHVKDTQDEALDSLKEYLDRRESDIARGRGADGSPSALEYSEAFDRLGKLPAGYEAMLEAHLNAPDHCITATQLAEAAGYENYNAANLHYGKLGQMIAEELNYNPRTRADGSVVWTAAIAGWPEDINQEELERALERREDDGHFEWTMRPQVVEALTGRRSGSA